MRCIVGTQIVTGQASVTVLGHPAGLRRLRHRVGYLPQDPTIYNDLRIDRQRSLFRGAVRIRRQRRRRGDRAGGPDGSPHGLLRQPLRRSAHQGVAGLCAGLPSPSCWCSTSRRSGWIPCCGWICGSSSPTLARRGTTLLVSSHVMDEADHCGDLLLMREGRLVAHTTPDPTTRGHRMHVTGGRVSVHHQTQHTPCPQAG